LWDSANIEAQETIHETRLREETAEADVGAAKRSFKGNYVQDFPEEFAASWSVENSPSLSGLYPSGHKPTSGDLDSEYELSHQPRTRITGNDDVAAISFDSPFPHLETALDRQQSSPRTSGHQVQRQERVEPFERTPQEVETSYDENHMDPTISSHVRNMEGSQLEAMSEGAEFTTKSKSDFSDRKQQDRELVEEIKQIYEESYGSIASDSRLGVASLGTNLNVEPTLYKILAYDPTMQAINVAETTSIVRDNSTALTPAEVLLRLSNPAKFFPHFGPLRAEGYEIVSGSGDVLVFRRVREPQAPKPEIESPPATQEASPAPAAASRINPIDMMGSHPGPVLPKTGNFASPTGFVNYDDPTVDGGESRTKPPPPFRSMIDVRREEPVFSGPKGKQRPPKKSLGRRMLTGAVWVAGISYAIGVVGEYFRTGGFDGSGPKGF
jgi:hypothetical protein